MNTFAYILLGFPFFLAIKNRLTAYTSLASKPAVTGTTAQPAGQQGNEVTQALNTTQTIG